MFLISILHKFLWELECNSIIVHTPIYVCKFQQDFAGESLPVCAYYCESWKWFTGFFSLGTHIVIIFSLSQQIFNQTFAKYWIWIKMINSTWYILILSSCKVQELLEQTSITAQLFRVIEVKLSMDFQIVWIAYQLAFGTFEHILTIWWLKR